MFTFNDETVHWAMIKLDKLKHLKGFPVEPVGVEAVATALLNIAHPVIVEQRLKWNFSGKFPEDFPYPDADTQNPPVEVLEAVRLEHAKIPGPPINPVDWLISWAIGKFKFFPAPIELRQYFVQKFPTADGLEPEEED